MCSPAILTCSRLKEVSARTDLRAAIVTLVSTIPPYLVKLLSMPADMGTLVVKAARRLHRHGTLFAQHTR